MIINKNFKEYYWIYGKHAVEAAISNQNRDIKRIIISNIKKKDFIDNINYAVVTNKKKIKIEIVNSNKFKKLFQSSVHQGIAAFVKPLKLLNINSFIKYDENSNLKIAAMLSNIKDPHNLGAIIRSAVAFNINHIFIKKKNSSQDSKTVSKVSCGGIDKISIFDFGNTSSSMRLLKKNGWFIFGLDAHANITFKEIKNEGIRYKKVLLVVGSESKGINPLIKNYCDLLIKIPINTKNIDSLNVSCAASLAFYSINEILFQ